MMEFTINNANQDTALCISQVFSGIDENGRSLMIAIRNKDINEAIVNTANGLTKIKWNYGQNKSAINLHISSEVIRCTGTVHVDDFSKLFDPWLNRKSGFEVLNEICK